MDIYLANLKEKSAPNIKQKDGLSVFFATNEIITPEIDEALVERDEEGAIIIDYREDTIVPKKKFICKIVDNSKNSKINRELLLKKLQDKKLLPIIQKMDSQTSKLAETVVVEEEELGIKLQEKEKEKEKEKEVSDLEDDELSDEEEEEEKKEISEKKTVIVGLDLRKPRKLS